MDGGRMESEVRTTRHMDPQEEEELYTLLEREEYSHRQWFTQLEMFGLTLLTVVVNFVRGTKQFDSVIGIE